mgnify:CR=1 FL=1
MFKISREFEIINGKIFSVILIDTFMNAVSIRYIGDKTVDLLKVNARFCHLGSF